MSTAPVYIGLDVCQERLDAAVDGSEQTRSFTNDEPGIAELVKWCAHMAPARIALEATGKLEMQAVIALTSAGLPVIVANPAQVRDFAKGIGKKAKTDPIDAQVLARFAAVVNAPMTCLPNADHLLLKELVMRRGQLLEMITAESNRLKRTIRPVQDQIGQHLEVLKAQRDEIDRQSHQIIRQSPVWQETKRLLLTVPGVGTVTAALLIACLPELGHLDRWQIAALVGLAPFSNDSGKKSGYRAIRGGRTPVRNGLYMAALVAAKHNPVIAQLYNRLIQRGKKPKVALTACMRKLLTILNTMITDHTAWQPAMAT